MTETTTNAPKTIVAYTLMLAIEAGCDMSRIPAFIATDARIQSALDILSILGGN